MNESSRDLLKSPVRSSVPNEPKEPERGIAICLSGGGYRAMLFHLGSLLRLNEVGVLGRVKRISSVSGGSITAGVLGLQWKNLAFRDGSAPADRFHALVIDPIRRMADRTIDVKSVIVGALLPGLTISDRVSQAYDKYLFNQATLQDLPSDAEGPRFVINATNVQTGSLWRFSKPYMGDFRVGLWKNPDLAIAVAVAASSAFPPVLSPCLLDMQEDPEPILSGEPVPPCRSAPFTTRVVLSDGGVYDNLGLETAYKRYDTLLVSDGGMKMAPDPEPHEDWGLHSKRIMDLIDNQVRSLRKRLLIGAFEKGERQGAYWGVATHLVDYGLTDSEGKPENPFGYLSTDCPRWKDTADLAATPTRLAAMEAWRQEGLINWGYVVCDTALRAHAISALKALLGIEIKSAMELPYPSPR